MCFIMENVAAVCLNARLESEMIKLGWFIAYPGFQTSGNADYYLKFLFYFW